MNDALRLLQEYAAHLREGASAFGERGLDPEFLGRCQEFDSAFRSLDAGQLQAASETDAGRPLVRELSEAQSAFQAAVALHREELDAQRNGLRDGARALRGYSQAGVRGGENATFLSKRG